MKYRPKKTLLTVVGTLILPLLLIQCQFTYKRGNGNIQKAEYKVDAFTQINVGGYYDLELIPGRKPMVVVETDENLLPYINVEVYNDVLNINNVQNIKSTEGIRIMVFYQNLNGIQLSGASRITNDEPIRTDELKIGLSGSGAVTLDVESKNIEVRLSGAGLITLTGKTQTLEGQLSGAGMLDGIGLEAENCKMHVSGIGGADVWVTETLEASITGIGGIKFKGQPKVIERNVTGLGKITRLEKN